MNCLRLLIRQFLSHCVSIFGKIFGRIPAHKNMGVAVKTKMVWIYLGNTTEIGLVFSANKKMDCYKLA